MSHRVLGAACALLLAGCYRYVPLGGAPAPAGSEVRLYLTPEGTSGLESSLGPQTTVVAGRVDAGRDGGLSVVVSSTTKAYGGTMRWMGERVTIPLGAIARGERRVLDRRRTLLAGGAVALAAAGGFALLRAVSGEGSGDDGPGPIGPSP
jgi:hypothetical protein